LISTAWSRLLLFVLLLALNGCRTAPPVTPIDLTQPGWNVQQGQAVWTAARDAEAVAGELLVATQPDGACWIQFSKPPFNLFTAHRQTTGWRIEFQQGHKQFSGRGTPPARIIWFQLAAAVLNQPLAADWKFGRGADDSWVLSQSKTGERLEGYLSP